MKHFMRSPAHYQAYLQEEQKDTPALRLGSIIHTAVLEPDKLKISQAPEGNKNSNAYKAALAKIMENSGPDIEIVTPDEEAAILGVQKAILEHPVARKLLANGRPELSLWWIDKQSGVECKCRPDWLWDDGKILVDLKTTEDANYNAFSRSIAKYGYHFSAAHYLMGLEHHGFKVEAYLFLAVEKKPPYGVGIYRLDYTAESLARDKVQKTLFEFKKCSAMNLWPGYPEEIREIGLPWYEQRKLDEELKEDEAA